MDHAGKLTITRTTTWRSNLVASATGTQTCPIVIKAQEKVTFTQENETETTKEHQKLKNQNDIFYIFYIF